MKFLNTLFGALAGTIGQFFKEYEWVGTDAYRQRTARRNALLDQVAQRV